MGAGGRSGPARIPASCAALLLAGALALEAHAADVPHPRPKPVPPAEAAIAKAAIAKAAIAVHEDGVPIPLPRPRADGRPATPAAGGGVAGQAPPSRATDPGAVPPARPDPSTPDLAPRTAALSPGRVAGPAPETLRGRHRACEAALRALGARFERGRAIREGACGAPRPLVIAAIGDVALSTPATMRCPAAVAFARWVREVVEPSASRHFRSPVRGLSVAASYHCRTRRNGRRSNRLSEHALANAIDIAAVELGAGRSVPVRPRSGNAPDARFQKEVRAGACRLFTTVLGPGSDGVHENHLHFDLAERRSGFRLCR